MEIIVHIQLIMSTLLMWGAIAMKIVVSSVEFYYFIRFGVFNSLNGTTSDYNMFTLVKIGK